MTTLAHHLYLSIHDDTLGTNFLAHRLAEWIGFTIAGVLIVGSVALVRNWAARR